MVELYVYYRAESLHGDELQRVVQAWQADLSAVHSGLRARLLKRSPGEDGCETWMETYAMRPGHESIDASLRCSLAAGPPALGDLLRGPRHIEAFTPCA